jgi:hypothetical protein
MGRDPAINTERAALDYATRRWSVIPLAPREKKPLVSWTEFQHRHANEDEIRAWFRHWPSANVGIVTGAVSDLIVIDVDVHHDGEESLATLQRTHGDLPATIGALTGGGGRHVYLRHPGGLVHNMVGLVAGIDVRGDGGLVVAPPSIHPSGRAYRWHPSHGPDEITLADVPDWLLALIQRGKAQHPSHPAAYWRALVRDGVGQGRRNDTIASFAGHLLWHGVDAKVAEELLICWNQIRCRPPLDVEEVARTVESIHRIHRRKEKR